MAWVLDNPWAVSGLDNAEGVTPAFDGRHVWVAQNDGSVIALDFWGPYSDLPNDDASARYKAEEFDFLHATAQGPALRIKATLTTSLVSILGVRYYQDNLYVLGRSATHLVLCKAAVSNVSPSSANTFVADETEQLGLLVDLDANSEIAAANGFLYFVTMAPEDEDLLNDHQHLVRVDLSDYSMTQIAIESTKQFEKRFIEVANDTLYVSSFNTLSVLKFNATTGAFISAVAVNRDVDRLLAIGNDIYVVSSLKAPSDIDGTLFPTSMVSKIDTADSDTVTPVYGVAHPSMDFNPVTVAVGEAHAWFTTATGGYQRTKTSDSVTIVSSEDIVTASDMLFGLSQKGIEVTGNEPAVADISTADPVTFVYITPPTSYEWFNGTTFDEIDVPRYLFLIQAAQVVAVMLPNELKFKADFSINQFTAISTGAYSYKGD